MSNIDFSNFSTPLGVVGGPGKIYSPRDRRRLEKNNQDWPEHGVMLFGLNPQVVANQGSFVVAPVMANLNQSRPYVVQDVNWKHFTKASYSNFNITTVLTAVHGGIDQNNKLWTWGASSPALMRVAVNPVTPTQVGTDDWIQFASCSQNTGTASFSLALRADGTLWCGGTSSNGQSGNNNTSTTTTAMTQVGTDSNWADCWVFYQLCFATKTDGSLWSWGSNGNFMNGRNLSSGNTLVPSRVGTGNDWLGVKLAASNVAMLACKADGTMWGWGANSQGMNGQGLTSGGTGVPTRIGTDSDWVDCDAGYGTTIMIKNDGRMFVLGSGVWISNATGNILTPYLAFDGTSDMTKIKHSANCSRGSFFFITEANTLHYYAYEPSMSITPQREDFTFVTKVPETAKLVPASNFGTLLVW